MFEAKFADSVFYLENDHERDEPIQQEANQIPMWSTWLSHQLTKLLPEI
jgi:hypothetical protein